MAQSILLYKKYNYDSLGILIRALNVNNSHVDGNYLGFS